MTSAVRKLLQEALPDLAFAPATSREGLWLAGREAPLFRVAAIAGRPCLWQAERVGEIAGDLDAAAPLLDRIEAATGWRFEPEEVRGAGEGEAFAVGDGATVVELVVEPGIEPPARLIEAAAAAPEHRGRPRARELVLQGPALDLAEADALAPGDLVLLPQVGTAELREVEAALVFDLAKGELGMSRWTDADDGQDARFAVALRIALPPVLLSAAQLDQLEEGSPLIVGPLNEGARVTLLSGERTLAQGKVVRLGSAIAVRVAQADVSLESEL